jgi:DNA-binding NtrC family response regulator
MQRPKVILIVDDDREFLDEIHALLCERDYTVISCSNAEQVLALTRNYLPDQIILDLAMPRVRGEDLLRILHKRHPQIPVVVCTGVPNVDPGPLLEGGCREVFQKPFSPEALFRSLEAA